jgi:hypothetical protein
MTSVAFTACAWTITSQYGVDRHTWDVPPELLSGAGMVSPSPSDMPIADG